MALKKIGRYQIKEELGRGGAATVYRGYDPSFEREVAIKVLPREFLHDPHFRERFQREIKTIASLEHPAIVPVYDAGEDGGLPYFVMRYMPGGSLADWIEKGAFSLRDTARIIERISQALAYAHKKGVIHRDIKPDNILFDDTDTPFISDFGVSKLLEAPATLSGNPMGAPTGTPAYMSPEQAQGQPVDGRSDIYGMGAMIYHMLSGRQPYSAEVPMGMALKHVNDPVPEILKACPDLPEAMDTVIKTAMAKNKNERYPNILELSRALNMIAFGSENSSPTIPVETRLERSAPASSGVMAPMIVGAAVLVIAAAIFFLRNQLFVPAEAAATATPTMGFFTPTVELAPPTTELTLAPVEEVAPTETVIPFAPQCAAENIPQVPVPDPKVTNKTCVLKKPYTTISIPSNASYVSQSSRMRCQQERILSDRLIISCTGPQLFTFDLKLCLPPPVTSSALTDQCAQTDIYNETNQCCYPAPLPDASCTIFKVDLGACP